MTQLMHDVMLREGVLAELGPAPKIALLRAGGFGDFLSMTAALKGLMLAIPEAAVTLLTSPLLARFRGAVHGFREDSNRSTIPWSY